MTRRFPYRSTRKVPCQNPRHFRHVADIPPVVPPGRFPMIVERFGPAIYLKRRIQFTSQPPLPADDDPAIEVPFDGQPFAGERKLTQDAKQAVLTAIQARSQKTGHVHCLVLTPAIGLYVYPGKSIVTKGIPPRSSAPTPIKVVKR